MEVILKMLVVLLLLVLYVTGMAIEAVIGLFTLVLPVAVPVLCFGLPVLLIALRLRFQRRINPNDLSNAATCPEFSLSRSVKP